MAKKIILALSCILAVFLAYVAIQPSDYTIARETKINSTPEKIFPYLNNSKLMDKWSPWSELDPQAKMVFSGPEEGVGSKTSWEAGAMLGTGSATVVESIPNQRVAVKLEYIKPFHMSQDAEFLIKALDKETIVVWSVRGQNSFPGRLMCIFSNMDKTVGGIFEKGLSNLKNMMEKTS